MGTCAQELAFLLMSKKLDQQFVEWAEKQLTIPACSIQDCLFLQIKLRWQEFFFSQGETIYYMNLYTHTPYQSS